MPTYDVYPKEGKMFSIDCQIERVVGGFLLESAGKKGFLWARDLAAIMPDRKPADDEYEQDRVCFSVFLKGHNPTKVLAHSFDSKDMIFKIKRRTYGQSGSVEYPETPIEVFTYIDESDIIAIIPSDFLNSSRKQDSAAVPG